MMREEKMGERECEGEGGGEKMAKKWTEGLLMGNSYKRAGPSTPPPTWRLLFSQPPRDGASAAVDIKEFLTNPDVSARKLCAELWEIEQVRSPIMRRGLRKLRRRDKVEEKAYDDGPPHDNQTLSTCSLRRQISGPNQRLIQRNGHAVQPVSPASYSSTLEVKSHPLLRPNASTDSLEYKSQGCSLKTSSNLLKVLNRIWSLEEQHAANMLLVKDLKTELDQCREEIKELKQTKRTDEVKESKFRRRGMEQEKDEIESVREELENERKLRRESDSLQRKLGRELCEVKCCFVKTLKELERERRARVLLENLCDEFAETVKEYEDDLRRIGSKSPVVERENIERLIVHVAEAWLDERAQTKLDEDDEEISLGKNSIVDKLGLDIETFLRVKRSNDSRKDGKRSHSRLHYLDPNKGSSRRQGKGRELRVSSINSQNLHECSDSSNDRFPEEKTRRDNHLQLLKDLCRRKTETGGDCMIRNQSVSSEGDKIYPEGSSKEAEHCGSHDLHKSITCLKRPPNVKHDSLQAKLMEARISSRRSRS